VFWGGGTAPAQTHGERKRSPHTSPPSLGAFDASILAPAALDLGPRFANPGSATDFEIEYLLWCDMHTFNSNVHYMVNIWIILPHKIIIINEVNKLN